MLMLLETSVSRADAVCRVSFVEGNQQVTGAGFGQWMSRIVWCRSIFMTSDTGDLFSRNWAFIAPDLQARLNDTCIFAAGSGLSSTIVALACRTGFGAFILADGDQVENSNLNRQAFFRRQIGENKATATAELLRDIRSDVRVTVLPEYIEDHSYRDSLDQAQIVINSIDYDNPALFALARDARARGIPMIIPLNLGWGGAVMIFTADSMPLEEFLGLDSTDALNGAEVSARLVTGAFAGTPGGVPPYLAELLADFQERGAEWPCEPQLGPAASLSAAMVVRAATALVAREPVRVAPSVFHIDLRAQLEPAPQTLATAQPALVTPPASAEAMPASQLAGTAAPQPTPSETTIQRMPTSKRTDDDFRVYLRSRQQAARYPALTALATRGRTLLFQRNRPSGLWAFAIRHDGLEADALTEFGEFRIDQYALAGLYDTKKIAQRGYRTDPSLASLPAHTIHVLSGTTSGQLLACCSIVPPVGPLYSEPEGWLVKRRRPLTLGDEERALFPAETELFGRGVFESLPAIQEESVERMREVAHLMRNQAINSPLAGIAIFEVCYALTETLTNPRLGIDFALGSAGPEARNLMRMLNIPMLYAPWAQVVVSETKPDEDFWIPPPNAEGYFWPYVIPIADLRTLAPIRQQLDNALGSPARAARSAIIEVANLAKTSALPQPQFVLRAQMPPRWYASPPYGPPIPIVGAASS
jgi:molybdopterin/thiamine biosynthesis adenylyltransferase